MKNAPYRPTPAHLGKAKRKYQTQEAQLQRACYRYFCYQYPLLTKLYFKIHNEGKKDKKTAELDKAAGIVAGIPDSMFAYPTSVYAGLFIEFKTPEGVLSNEQKTVHAQLREQKYRVEVIRTVDAFIDLLQEYLDF